MSSPSASGSFTTEEVRFTSGGEEIAAVLVRPETTEDVPCVVLGHGFGALKEGGPIRSAERFAAAGFAGLAFDYRYFGESGGEPRQLVDIGAQLDDWRAAIAYARELDGVDSNRLALWGSSFSGGHVIKLASEDPAISCVISQAPFIDGLETLKRLGLGNTARLTAAGIRDQAGALLGRSPYRIPIVGAPGTTAVMSTPDAEPGYRSIYDDDFEWREDVVARIALRVGTYRPGLKVKDVKSPLLIQVASDDSITPPGPAIEAAGEAPAGELIVYAGLSHFDIYRGEHFERAVSDQTAFLQRHLTKQ